MLGKAKSKYLKDLLLGGTTGVIGLWAGSCEPNVAMWNEFAILALVIYCSMIFGAFFLFVGSMVEENMRKKKIFRSAHGKE